VSEEDEPVSPFGVPFRNPIASGAEVLFGFGSSSAPEPPVESAQLDVDNLGPSPDAGLDVDRLGPGGP